MIGGSRGCDASRAAVAAAARILSAGFNGQLPLRRPSACPLPRFRYPDEMDIYSTFAIYRLPSFSSSSFFVFPAGKQTETFGGRGCVYSTDFGRVLRRSTGGSVDTN